MNIHKAEFKLSVGELSGLPPETLPEIAFAGKSNVGKSSVINRLLLRKNIARVGEKPGKTVCINFFSVDNTCYFADLPGYGFAKVPPKEKARWSRLMEGYFATGRIRLGVFIVDARHAPTSDDVVMANWFRESGCPFVVVANKLDKVKKSELDGNLKVIREKLNLSPETEIIPFSAEKGTGREELLGLIEAASKDK